MMKDYRPALFMCVTVAVTTLYTVGTSAQVVNDRSPPPRPTWVDEDGKVNIDKAPREVSTVDPDGKAIYEGGKEKMVPSYIGAVPPPPLR